MEDFVHDYYSVEKFRKAYARLVEPLPDREKWPKVDLPFEVAAPLTKRGVGRQRKSRYKSCLEGGSGGPKTAVKAAENENEKTKKRVRGKVTCPRCGQMGHRQASYKCPMNGTKKRKRKPRKNTTKGWTPKEQIPPDSPITTREQVMQESPGMVTRGRLAMLMGEGTSQEASSQTLQTTTPSPNKMTPRKAKRSLAI